MNAMYPSYPAGSVTITHAKKDLRAAGAAYLAHHHYMRSSGGSGCLYVVEGSAESVQGACLIGATASRNVERALLGACLIGPTNSPDAERSLASNGTIVRQIKRLHVLDTVPMYESHLLRHAMHHVTDTLNQPVLFVSYADLGAIDARGIPMGGFVYLSAGFMCVGETARQRWCVIDHTGAIRSTRQGAVTLAKRTLPKAGDIFHGERITRDWRMTKVPPARIWIAIQTPRSFTRLQAKRAKRAIMHQLNPKIRIAAAQWVDFQTWSQRPNVVVSLGHPKRLRGAQRFQPAWWPPQRITQTAAPVWVPLQWQQHLFLEMDMSHERTAGRLYTPFLG